MNVYLDQSDSNTTDKKGCFRKCHLWDKDCFWHQEYALFKHISTPLFLEYKFRVIAQDMRKIEFADNKNLSVFWKGQEHSAHGALISTFTETHSNSPKWQPLQVDTESVVNQMRWLLPGCVKGRVRGSRLDVFGLSVVWKRGRSDVGSSYL